MNKKVSGNKNSYYFLNRLLCANPNEISRFWKEASKNQAPVSTNPLFKNKYTITSKHWKMIVKSMLEKGSAITQIEMKTLILLLKITKEPELYMKNNFGVDIITFKKPESKKTFIDKCINNIYPWLRNITFENMLAVQNNKNLHEGH